MFYSKLVSNPIPFENIFNRPFGISLSSNDPIVLALVPARIFVCGAALVNMKLRSRDLREEDRP